MHQDKIALYACHSCLDIPETFDSRKMRPRSDRAPIKNYQEA
jgi:hypothetical protein